MQTAAQFELRLRVPGWCQGATVSVNQRQVTEPVTERGYLVLSRTWRKGDVVELNLPMPVERVAANPQVKEDLGQLAIQRGPLVYCLEACDQTAPLASLSLPANAVLKTEKRDHLLGGVVVITGTSPVADEQPWTGRLYQAAAAPRSVSFTAIPYYAWDNRQPGPMKVWLPVAPPPPLVRGVEQRASVALSFTSDNCQPWGINDGLDPQASHDHPAAVCHWWPHKGTDEWAQYTWPAPVQLSSAKVYWFDDEGSGQCRLPAAWQIEYLDGRDWKPVAAKEYPILKDHWCATSFPPVTTTALRLAVKLKPGWATGVQEWRVAEPGEE